MTRPISAQKQNFGRSRIARLTERWQAFLTIALLLVPLPAASETLTKISVGLGTSIDFLPAYVAKETGIFVRHGLDVNLIKMATPSVVPPVLVAGSIQ
ncbi:MAG: hypothetical protein ACREIW_03035, partial [Chthoniobacterales bacterium]